MKVKTSADYPDSDLVILTDLKFVVYELGGEREIVLTNSGRDHSKVLPATATLVGAGIVKKEGDISWGSDTCRSERGYDRPSNSDDAETVAAEVRASIIEWRQSIK